ncbi:MFS transporter [Nanoarchaeota archaeon]
MIKKHYLERNINIIYIYNFLMGLMFLLPIYALYLKQELFTVFNVTLIIAIGSIALLIFEVPSGAFADLFGRKKTIILSSFFAVISLIFLVIGGSMIFFIINVLLSSLSRALLSGSDSALLYDSIEDMKKKKIKQNNPHFKKVIGINSSMWPIGASISAFFGGILAAVDIRLPIIITIIPFTFAFLITFFLREPDYEKESHKNLFKQMFTSTKILLKNKQILLLAIAGFMFYSFGETAHQLNPIFFEFKMIPLEYFGMIFAGIFAMSFIGHFFSHNFSEKFGNKTTLLITAIIPPILLFCTTLVNGLFIVLFLIPSSIFFGLRRPVIAHMLNLEVESKHRATVISIGNFANMLGLAIFALIFGYLIDLYNINFVFKIIAGCAFLAVLALLFVKNKN